MMRIAGLPAFLLLSVWVISSCGPAGRLTKSDEYAGMYEEKPVVLGVMPPINNSAVAEAKDLLYTSISKPLIEAGYYVLSPNLLMDIFKAESAYDSELFIEADLGTFREVLGADAMVFSIIDEWAKKGTGIQTVIRYIIRSTHTGETVFDRKCDLYLDLTVSSGAGGLLGALVDIAGTAINTALTDHIVAARKCNNFVFSDIPHGKYSPDYLRDMNEAAGSRNITASVK